ncbi:MAG: hypothetical protein KJP16_11360 [Gammaproteobacteria bacterium]|nr:hypothetical protein [Gammaproteobacteria bacterium]
MMASPRIQLEHLERLREEFGAQAASEKLRLLAFLEQQSLAHADEVERLHEALCFARAWPDSPKLLTTVNRMLGNFGERRDLQRFARKLADSGIAGTDIRFQFYFATACWLAARWGDELQIDWKQFKSKERLSGQLRFLTLFSEKAALEQFLFDSQEWIEQMRGNDETDAVFLINRYAALRVDESVRDAMYEQLDPALQLSPSATTPARTREYLRPKTVHYQKRSIDRKNVDLRKAANRQFSIDTVPRRQAKHLVDLARSAMVSRLRDLDAFAYASVDDVLRVRCEAGIQIMLFGIRPERRYFLECEYGYLMLKNGAVIGYGTGTGLFGTCQLAFNLFPSYRGAETRALYAWVLATFRRLFNADTFSVDAYQIGADNEEAIDSGAWWFYARMGFLPRDKAARELAKTELRNGRKKGYRTTKPTLRRLARHTLFFSLADERQDILGPVCTDTVSLGVIDYVSRQFGSRREAATRRCSQELAQQLDLGSLANWSRDEKLMWRRLSPLFAATGGVASWPKADRDSLVNVIRAKGGVHEADYVKLFDAHKRLRRTVAEFSNKVANLY